MTTANQSAMPSESAASLASHTQRYLQALHSTLTDLPQDALLRLGQALLQCWDEGQQVFLCGNGGSAGNAIHLANDLIYGVGAPYRKGMRAHALPANPAVLTCLANDCGYDQVFSTQLKVQGQPGDLLIVLSGSGNSPNILEALTTARALGMHSCAIVGYQGGKAAELADIVLHTAVQDMQISEDMQLVIGHLLMQWLREQAACPPKAPQPLVASSPIETTH